MQNHTKQDKIKLMKEAVERINSLPESEKHYVSQDLLDRMQSEAEVGDEPISDEQRRIWREKWLNNEDE